MKIQEIATHLPLQSLVEYAVRNLWRGVYLLYITTDSDTTLVY